ncbi:hypothetical protein CPB83DRAFT_859367 [Crepidotus variabilis]|uniref:Uncharacterized protein n=1 Tax=Crepidotus variabilis TaxID=179855 RepID=A0A9P6EAE6_9AGAR|nr:hypothetical protein CPB83DRAFT_859367 [Crepidotus variabilis]
MQAILRLLFELYLITIDTTIHFHIALHHLIIAYIFVLLLWFNPHAPYDLILISSMFSCQVAFLAPTFSITCFDAIDMLSRFDDFVTFSLYFTGCSCSYVQ